MIMNNLHPDVAERPDELVVYGGIGRAARDWECFDKIVEVIAASDAERVSMRSSVSAPIMPLRPANTVPMRSRRRRAVSITPQAEALITAVTPPDWA